MLEYPEGKLLNSDTELPIPLYIEDTNREWVRRNAVSLGTYFTVSVEYRRAIIDTKRPSANKPASISCNPFIKN
jgi:hypothetical protein